MASPERCGRPAASTGRPCRHFRVVSGLRTGPACHAHLTEEERADWHRTKDADTVALWGPLPAGPAEPACWSWPVPGDIDELTRAVVAGLGPATAARILRDEEVRASAALSAWHEQRCAICGLGGELVTDHDHDNGLIRGKLCRPCNTAEGMNRYDTTGLYAAYRERHPASILGVRACYYDPISKEYAQPRPPVSDDPWENTAMRDVGM